jgi:hypothetical protein
MSLAPYTYAGTGKMGFFLVENTAASTKSYGLRERGSTDNKIASCYLAE